MTSQSHRLCRELKSIDGHKRNSSSRRNYTMNNASLRTIGSPPRWKWPNIGHQGLRILNTYFSNECYFKNEQTINAQIYNHHIIQTTQIYVFAIDNCVVYR